MDPEQPVVEGTAGTETRRRTLVSPHTTATADRVWNSTIAQQHVKATGTAGYFRNLYAIQDEGSETAKTSYRLLHHFLGKDGHAGPASTRACSEAIEWLNKGLFPEEERHALFDHLAGHLRDAGHEVPALGPIDDYGYPLDEAVKHTLWAMDSILAQIELIRDFRSRKGMTLTQARLTQLETMQQKFAALCTLVSLKYLDQPTDAVLAQMSAEARAEAIGQRIEAMQEKVKRDTAAVDQEMTAAVVKRIQAKLDAART